MNICIVIPIYNEEIMVKESIETILTYTSNLLHNVSIIAVNDGSNDSTKYLLQQITNRDEDNKLI